MYNFLFNLCKISLSKSVQFYLQSKVIKIYHLINFIEKGMVEIALCPY